MAKVPHREAGPPKKKKKPSVNPVGVNRHNMKANTHFPGTGVSFKGEVKPTFPEVGKTAATAALMPFYLGELSYDIISWGAKKAGQRLSDATAAMMLVTTGIDPRNKIPEEPLIQTWDDRNDKNNGTKLNPKDMLTGFMDK